jgi:hypothetical protein
MDRCGASRIAAEKGSQLISPARRPHLRGHHQDVLGMGPAAYHAARKVVHPVQPSPKTVADSQGCGHPEAGKAGLFQGPRLPGDLTAKRNQKAGCHGSSSGQIRKSGKKECGRRNAERRVARILAVGNGRH